MTDCSTSVETCQVSCLSCGEDFLFSLALGNIKKVVIKNKLLTMFRGDNNPFLAVFRRRNNARDSALATEVTEDADEQRNRSVEHPGSIEEEEKEEVESSDVSFMTHLMIQHTQSFDEDCDWEPEEDEEEDDDDDHKPPAFPLKANPVRDSLDGSSCSQLLFDGDSSSANCSTDASARDSAAKKAKRKPKKKWMNEAAKFGWTPGHIKVTGEDRYVLGTVPQRR